MLIKIDVTVPSMVLSLVFTSEASTSIRALCQVKTNATQVQEKGKILILVLMLGSRPFSR